MKKTAIKVGHIYFGKGGAIPRIVTGFTNHDIRSLTRVVYQFSGESYGNAHSMYLDSFASWAQEGFHLLWQSLQVEERLRMLGAKKHMSAPGQLDLDDGLDHASTPRRAGQR
jgi:hypothetical protein